MIFWLIVSFGICRHLTLLKTSAWWSLQLFHLLKSLPVSGDASTMLVCDVTSQVAFCCSSVDVNNSLAVLPSCVSLRRTAVSGTDWRAMEVILCGQGPSFLILCWMCWKKAVHHKEGHCQRDRDDGVHLERGTTLLEGYGFVLGGVELLLQCLLVHLRPSVIRECGMLHYHITDSPYCDLHPPWLFSLLKLCCVS